MAIIGFIAVILLGLAIIAATLACLWVCHSFSGIRGSEMLKGLLGLAIGGFLLYWGAMHAPFEIIMR
jgi:hypothetical protein